MIHSNHSIHNQQLDSRPDSTSLYSWQIWNITFSWTWCLFCTESVSPWFWASGQGVEKPMALWSWQALPKHSDVYLHSKWNIKIGVGEAGRDVKTSSVIFGTIPSGWVEFRSCESGMMNPSVVFGWRFGSVYIVMLRLQHCRQIVYRWATREALTPMRLVLSLYQSQVETRRLHTSILCVCVCVCARVCVCVCAGAALVARCPEVRISCDAGDTGSVPGSGSSPAEGNESPLQYYHQENPMDRETWWATVHGVQKSQTQRGNQTVYGRDYIYKQYSVSCNMSQNCHHLKVYK